MPKHNRIRIRAADIHPDFHGITTPLSALQYVGDIVTSIEPGQVWAIGNFDHHFLASCRECGSARQTLDRSFRTRVPVSFGGLVRFKRVQPDHFGAHQQRDVLPFKPRRCPKTRPGDLYGPQG